MHATTFNDASRLIQGQGQSMMAGRRTVQGHHARVRHAAVFAVLVHVVPALLGVPAPAHAQDPEDGELVQSAARYVAQFVDRFSDVVATERYEQRSINPNRTRALVSDFLIVQIPGFDDTWTSFRDVLEVDGEPVARDQERLLELLLEPSGTALQRAQALAQEGTRFNLQDIGQLNDPLRALAFAQPEYNGRFRWDVVRRDDDLGPDVWQLRFREFALPSLLRSRANRDVFTRGFLWIDLQTGRVLRTELEIPNFCEIITEFAYREEFGVAVPVEMRERYLLRLGATFQTVATYGDFRRFRVVTTEDVAMPPADGAGALPE